MTGLTSIILVHLHGTLNADASGTIRIPLAGATLVDVSACGSNVNDAKLTVGSSVNPFAYHVLANIGDSSVPTVFDASNFNGALADPLHISSPHMDKDTVLYWSIDHDGFGGTAAADVDIQFTLLEG